MFRDFTDRAWALLSRRAVFRLILLVASFVVAQSVSTGLSARAAGADPAASASAAPLSSTPRSVPNDGGQGGSAGAALGVLDSGAGGEAGTTRSSPSISSGGAGGEADAVASTPNGDDSVAATLPAPDLAPDVAPVVATQSERQEEPAPITPAERPRALLKTILGLLALFALAYMGGHPRVLRWEERLGISQVITTGFPFVLLGLLARIPDVGIVTDRILKELSPLLRIGLGLIGLVAGFRFDTRQFKDSPPQTALIALVSTLIPAAFVVGAAAPILWFSNGHGSALRDPVFLRDALILGVAGAMTARSALRRTEASVVASAIRMEAAVGVAGAAAVASFFRPHGGEIAWHLPGAAWLLLTIGLGTAIGLLFYSVLQTTNRAPEFQLVALGGVSFAAGSAGYLHLSSVGVAFVCGVMLSNFPGEYHARLSGLLMRMERPILLLSLFVIGAFWDIDDWRAWALMPVFAVARLAGKWLAGELAAMHPALPVSREDARVLIISPMGTLAVAIVVNALLLYPGGSISLILSAVIGGGVLTEIFVQLAARRLMRSGPEPMNSQADPASSAIDPRSEGGGK